MTRVQSPLGKRVIAVSHAHALQVAAEHSLTAYDARFLDAARSLDTRLMTEDRKLRKAAPTLTQSIGETLAA